MGPVKEMELDLSKKYCWPGCWRPNTYHRSNTHFSPAILAIHGSRSQARIWRIIFKILTVLYFVVVRSVSANKTYGELLLLRADSWRVTASRVLRIVVSGTTHGIWGRITPSREVGVMDPEKP